MGETFAPITESAYSQFSFALGFFANRCPAWCILAVLSLALIVLPGCGVLTDPGPAKTFDLQHLETPEQEALFVLISEDKELKLFTFAPKVTEDTTAPQIFASAVKSCSVEPGEKLPSVVRKVFVGLDKIKISSRQQSVIGENPVFVMSFTALFDKEPLAFASVSTVRDGCATDIALWTSAAGSDSSGGEASEPALERVSRARDILLNHLKTNGGRLFEELVK